MKNFGTHRLGLLGFASALLLTIAPEPGLTAQADLDTLYRECKPQLNLSEAGCRCISDTAAKELNDNQQAMIAAAVTKNDAKSAQLRSEMSPEEMMKAANFMMNAPRRCGNK